MPQDAAALLAQLIALGVPADLDVDVRCGPINVRFGGYFDPAEDGQLAVLVPIFPDAPSDDDMVAFFADNPSRWWRNSTAPILNPDAIDRAIHFQEPLAVWSSPLSWLRAGGDGVVILTDDLDVGFHLRGVPTVNAETVELAQTIDRRLRVVVSLPRIRVPRRAA